MHFSSFNFLVSPWTVHMQFPLFRVSYSWEYLSFPLRTSNRRLTRLVMITTCISSVYDQDCRSFKLNKNNYKRVTLKFWLATCAVSEFQIFPSHHIYSHTKYAV